MASDEGDSDTEDDRFIGIRVELADGLQYVEDIAEQLKLTGDLPKETVEEILHKEKTLAERKENLLDAILRKCAYKIFSDCLRVSGQDELHQLMVHNVLGQSDTQNDTYELTTLQYRVYCKYGKGDPKKILVPPHTQELLKAWCEKLQVIENVERLVDLMEDEGCLTTEATIAIREQSDDKETTNMLIDNVKKSTLYSFFLLTRFLDISQQKPLMSKITEEDTKTALGRMDGLLLKVYYKLLGGIALGKDEMEERLGLKARSFVTLSINRKSKAVDKRGINEAQVDQSPGGEIKLTELFIDKDDNKPTQKVLLIGAPGAGKTTAVIELARLASDKKIPNIPRPPFVIQLRTVEWKNETTLKNLLLLYGPNFTAIEQEKVWPCLSENAKEITVILDGADEVPDGFFVSKPAPVPGAEYKAYPKVILNNLISGKLLDGAHILVSSRPFGLLEAWAHFDRKVDVVGFNEKSLKTFLSKELPQQHLQQVEEFLAEKINIRSLLLTPLYAASFVVRAKDIENPHDLQIQSHTELSLSLIHSLVKTKLKKTQEVVRQKELDQQGRIVWKLSQLIAELLIHEGAIKIEMTEDDLDKAEVKGEECVGTGLFTQREIVEGDVARSIFEVPHQSLLESIAAIGLDESQIKKLVVDNDGRYDLIITYFIGIIAEERNRKMLSYILSKEVKKKNYTKLTPDVANGVLRSKRRELPGGEEFCMRIVHESLQWSFISDLKRVMGRWLGSNSSETLMLADQLLRHDPGKDKNDPLVRVQVQGIRSVKYCPRATALTQYGEVTTAADIKENAQHLHNIVSISFYEESGITRETVAGIAEQLSRLHKLEAVSMEDNTELWSSSDVSSALGCLSLIPSLHYLRLSCCGLTSADVSAITSSCECLQHLDISGNRGVRGGDVIRRQLTGLSVAGCWMKGEELVELVARNGQTLEFLDATLNNVLLSSHISAILTHCPGLVEMYVSRGVGELVRALSERRAVCLKHLWLVDCVFSSSSSSLNRVNSSELKYVLTRHPSISSLTLFHCRPFTSEFMGLLSSSMASITSLYISPHRSLDVASLVCESPSLTQLWLDGVWEWQALDYITVIHAVNASPALLRVLGLNMGQLSVDDVRDVVRELTRPLTRLWLVVDYKKGEMAEVVMEERELGVVQLITATVLGLYDTYRLQNGLFYQHLPPSLPEDDFRTFTIF